MPRCTCDFPLAGHNLACPTRKKRPAAKSLPTGNQSQAGTPKPPTGALADQYARGLGMLADAISSDLRAAGIATPTIDIVAAWGRSDYRTGKQASQDASTEGQG